MTCYLEFSIHNCATSQAHERSNAAALAHAASHSFDCMIFVVQRTSVTSTYLPRRRTIKLANLMEESKVTNQEYVYLTGNMLAMYIFAHILYFSGSGFKNLKAASALMSRKFPLLPNANTPFKFVWMHRSAR